MFPRKIKRCILCHEVLPRLEHRTSVAKYCEPCRLQRRKQIGKISTWHKYCSKHDVWHKTKCSSCDRETKLEQQLLNRIESDYTQALETIISIRRRIGSCECGELFLVGQTRKRCPGCQQRHQIEQKYDRKQRDRAEDGRYVEPIRRADIFERDGYICQMCGINLTSSTPNDEMQPTIDHIIPLAKGGTHEPDNVQTACRSCNSSKADRIPTPGVPRVGVPGTE